MAHVESQGRMNREMICGWLGLLDKRWPPDPYALLGLTPEQCDPPAIEERVCQRMTKLRGYQLLHPEEATEGMTRVAQAYIVLTERHGRPVERPPSAAVAPPVTAPKPSAAATRTSATRSAADTMVAEKTQLEWEMAPPPVRGGPKTPLPAIPVGIPEPPSHVMALDDLVAPAETEEQLIRNLAEESPEATDGLVSLPKVIERADRTRQLLIAWRKAGRYLGNPKRKVTRTVEKADFSRRLEEMRDGAEAYPAFVAQPGRPGYRAVALAHLTISAEVFNAMSEDLREQVARDWTLAHKILLAHRRLLLWQFKTLRRRGLVGRALHTLRVSFRDHPVLWTGLGAAVGVTACVLAVLILLGR
jgi:hypothetical protein